MTDFNGRLYRNALKMPALVLDEKEKQVSRFISSNGLVEDPCAAEKERALINPSTSEEKEIFIDKLAAFGKDFRKIASFLDHKTTADCVEFYYKNLKKKWSREFNAASLDVLGAASVITAHAENAMQNQKTSSGRIFFESHCNSRTSQFDDSIAKRSSSSDIIWKDEVAVAADAILSYGKDFGMISQSVGTRSRDQCKVFFSKARKCLGLDLIHPRTRSIGTPKSDNAIGDGSDTGDACVLESSVVCSKKLVSKMEDLPSSIVSMDFDESDINRETEPISGGGGDDIVVDCSKAESVYVHGTVALANLNAVRNHVAEQGPGVSIAVSGSLGEAVDPCVSRLDTVLEPKSDAGLGNDLEARETSLSKDGLDEHHTKCSADTSSRSICRLDANKAKDECIDRNSSSGFSFSSKNSTSDLNSTSESSGTLVQKEQFSAKNSAFCDSDAFQCEKTCNQDRLSSTLDYEKNENKRELQRFRISPELPHPLQNFEKASLHQKSHSRSLSDTEKLSRNGNVKPFGQIFNSSSRNNDKVAHFSKQSSKTLNSKFTSHENDGGDASLPDSAMLLAKYPAAFVNYPASLSQVHPQALQTLVRSTERNFNGVPVYSLREISSTGVDYLVYRGHHCMKQRGRGMVGTIVVGRVGLLSDSVAVLRMQYSKTKKPNDGQNESIIREEDSWNR
ncbi:Nuclear receptor corepressor 1 [Gossypium arboreum]|uniref:Nuclear receptor corepressor 1 n=1 Tax=Gossypium arboreum TaxID=29729 RepID=A0A0B0PXR4_GOSAR|nr:Nuclear receptor corepressor 1 [Gossypium arboreum]